AQPVFDAIVQSAARLCEAMFSLVFLYDGDLLRLAATHNFTPEVLDKLLQTYPKRPDRSLLAGRAVLDGRIVHVPDLLADREYSHQLAAAGNWRAGLAVPMLRDGKPVGAISVARAEAMPFSERQTQLLTTFADQAVIAIENVRLFTELQASNRDLSEALQQQNATADVLKVISRSTFDLQTVLDTLVESAARLCEAEMASMNRQFGEAYRQVASYGYSPEFKNFMETHPVELQRGTAVAHARQEKKPVEITDVLADKNFEYKEGAKIGGVRAVAAVPMIKGDDLIGVIAIYRREVRPFTDKQIELASTFADQAVIAIENVRLFEAEQERTRELTKALEQQTATSQVLQVISSSPGEVEPVFNAMLENARRICESKFGILFLCEADGFRAAAMQNAPPALVEAYTRGVILRPPPDAPLGGVAATKQVAQVVDIKAMQSYMDRDPFVVSAVELAGYRTVLSVPMLKDDELIGAINLIRQEVRPFTDKQIELVQNFARQAVIAIENTRLLNELRESLQQQTATADVLKVISRSTFDLQTVLDTLIESAVRLCEADMGSINRQQGDVYRQVANFGHSPALDKFMETHPLELSRGTIVGRTVLESRTVHIADVQTDPEYTFLEAARIGGIHTMLGIPLLREGTPIGVIVLQRKAARPF